MQLKKYKYIVGFFFIALITWACKKGIDENSLEKYQAGKNATVVDSLKLYNVKDDTARSIINGNSYFPFQLQKIAFKATISESASWEINIEGQPSGAKKKISGLSTGPDSISVIWNGESDNLYYFSKGDLCKVKFTVLGSSISMEYPSFYIKSQRLDSSFILIADFEPYVYENADASELVKFCPENILQFADPTFSINQPKVTAWNKFFDVENKNEEICGGYVFTNASCGDKDPLMNLNNNCGDKSGIVQPVNGVGYFHLHGQDYADEPSNYFIGGFNHDPVLYGIDPTKTVENIWVNFYANSLGNKSTNLKVKFYGIGGDQFSREFSIDWTGWKLVSVRLSDLALEIAGPNAPGKLVPAQLKRMGFEMLCNRGAGSGCEGEVAIDYVTITYDKPFNPNSINK